MFQRGLRRDRKWGGRASNRGALNEVGATARANARGRTVSDETRASTLTTHCNTRRRRLVATTTTTARIVQSGTRRIHACPESSFRLAAPCKSPSCVLIGQCPPSESYVRSAERRGCTDAWARHGVCPLGRYSPPAGAVEEGDICRCLAALGRTVITVFIV